MKMPRSRIFKVIGQRSMSKFDFFSCDNLLTLYTEHLITDLYQIWYTVSIWKGQEADLFPVSLVKGQYQNWTFSAVTTFELSTLNSL